MSEQIGKHKGAVETLLHEKKELSRILQIVNSQLQKHLSALEEAGVDTDQFIQEVQEQGQNAGKKKQSGNPGQGTRKRSESKQQKSNQGRKKSSSTGSREETPQGEDEDADELLEGEDDFSDRDFSPR